MGNIVWSIERERGAAERTASIVAAAVIIIGVT
jgi:hypothetical protein